MGKHEVIAQSADGSRSAGPCYLTDREMRALSERVDGEDLLSRRTVFVTAETVDEAVACIEAARRSDPAPE